MTERGNRLSEKFLGFGEKDFADWLKNGFINFYQGISQDNVAKIHQSFDGEGGLAFHRDSAGFSEIYYDCIPESKRSLFNRAIGNVLENIHEDDGLPESAIQDLIYLVGQVRAREALEPLASGVESGVLTKIHPRALFESLAVIKQLAPCEEACRATEKLINSPQVEERYLIEEVKILVLCKPKEALSILNKFLPRITNIRSQVISENERGRNAYTDLLESFRDYNHEFNYYFKNIPKEQIPEIEAIFEKLKLE
jgi:hypothetical protein